MIVSFVQPGTNVAETTMLTSSRKHAGVVALMLCTLPGMEKWCQVGVQGWKLLEGFRMEGILHQEEGGYQLIFAGQMSDSR